MEPITKRIRLNLDIFHVVLGYINRELLRKELILTYVTLVVCMMGMMYQCIDVLSSYLEYPTIMNVLEEREAAKFPAITMCLSPWYNLTMVCEKLDGKCTKKDIMVTLAYPKHGFFREWRTYGLSDPSKLFTCNMTSFLPECPAFECHTLLRHIYYKVPMMACYTLDLDRDLSKNHSYFGCPSTWSYELMVEARWNPKTTLTSMDMAYYPIFLHDSSTYAPEPMYSAAMRKDVFAYYTITQQYWSRLKKPYHTDCWNYRDRFGRRQELVFQGWMSQLSCEQRCKMEQELTHCKCVRTVNEFSHFVESDLCDISADEKCNLMMSANDSYFYKKCDGVCNSECSTTRYDVRLSGLRNYYPKNHKKKKFDDLMAGFSVSFSSATVEVYRLVPAMNGEMLMGILAGFIGVWVGLAFSDVADYVALLFPSEKDAGVPDDPLGNGASSYKPSPYNKY